MRFHRRSALSRTQHPMGPTLLLLLAGFGLGVFIQAALCGPELPTLLPADVPNIDGHASSYLCGPCCQQNMYCGKLTSGVTVADGTKDQLLVPQGTEMTCIMRARNVYGAVDGGLCVPVVFPSIEPITNFCQLYNPVRLFLVHSPPIIVIYLDSVLATELARHISAD